MTFTGGDDLAQEKASRRFKATDRTRRDSFFDVCYLKCLKCKLIALIKSSVW